LHQVNQLVDHLVVCHRAEWAVWAEKCKIDR
jgi:hypothetical protein